MAKALISLAADIILKQRPTTITPVDLIENLEHDVVEALTITPSYNRLYSLQKFLLSPPYPNSYYAQESEDLPYYTPVNRLSKLAGIKLPGTEGKRFSL